jgi:hypothetical protein
MRHWLFHPVIFYPLVAAFALGVILFSLKPQMRPRIPAPVAGLVAEDGALVLEGAAFNSPTDPPEQYVTVVRDFWGRPQSLRLAVLPGLPRPHPDETGVEIKLVPQSSRLISGRPLTVEISYRPLPVNAAPTLAVSLQGTAPARWVRREIPPLSGTALFDLPPSRNVEGLGLRAISNDTSMAFGVEIVSIRITPRRGQPAD